MHVPVNMASQVPTGGAIARPASAANVDSIATQRIGESDRAPQISQRLLGLFTWYSRRYLRRHFHSLRVSLPRLPPRRLELPTVIYSNHASWWDPIVGLLLKQEFFPQKNVYVPMEAAALARYGFFRRLGAFGVEAGTAHGAATFLRASKSILRDRANLLWLTPQARFTDARERPVQLKPGIAHLPRLAPRLCFLPVAIEYVFWEERLPEILVAFGQPMEVSSDDRVVKSQAWLEIFSSQLRQTQEALAAEALRRQPAAFRCLLNGRSGVGGIYDRWRGLRARLMGQQFRPQHGRL